MSAATQKNATLSASVREDSGKGAARALRREGKVPAILYSKGKEPMSITLDQNAVRLEYQRGRFRSRLIDIALDNNQTVKALPKDLQFHPVTDVIEHVDFIRIEPGIRLRVMIPVKVTGQDKSAGLKRGGVLNIVRHEIEFMVTAESMPTHIEINVEGLDIGDSLHINDIKLDKDVVPTIKRNFTIAAVAGRAAEEEEVKPVAAVAGAEGAAAPGAAPAAGAAAAPGAAPAAGAPAAGAAAPAAAKRTNPKKK